MFPTATSVSALQVITGTVCTYRTVNDDVPSCSYPVPTDLSSSLFLLRLHFVLHADATSGSTAKIDRLLTSRYTTYLSLTTAPFQAI